MHTEDLLIDHSSVGQCTKGFTNFKPRFGGMEELSELVAKKVRIREGNSFMASPQQKEVAGHEEFVSEESNDAFDRLVIPA
jgi:hypothetical protein